MFTLAETHLHPAGCQQWSTRIVCGSSTHVAFCSTLSIYVYDSRTFQLTKIIPGHERCISVLKWCPADPSLFAASSISGTVSVFSTSPAAGVEPVNAVRFASAVIAIDWEPEGAGRMVVSARDSSVYLWAVKRVGQGTENSARDVQDMEVSFAVLQFGVPFVCSCWFFLLVLLVGSFLSFLPCLVLVLCPSPPLLPCLFFSSFLPSFSLLVYRLPPSSVCLPCAAIPAAPFFFPLTFLASHSFHLPTSSCSSCSSLSSLLFSFSPPSSLSLVFFSLFPQLWSNRSETNPALALVIKWHPTDHALVAAGNSDGSIRLFDMSTRSLTKIPPMEKGVAIADMMWDPLSDFYMLVANENGMIKLMDVNSKDGPRMVRQFDRETVGIKALSWMDWAPGNFATCNGRTGVLKVWNVSQPQPIGHVRVGHTGLNTFTLIPNTSRAICSFVDGSVSVYHLLKKQKEFTSKPGHTETVFGCAYCPTDSKLVATSSYDATVKLWQTQTMSLTKNFVGQEGVIYSVCWSSDGVYLASAGIQGTVFIWDVETGDAVYKLAHHRGPCYCVDWNALGHSKLLATASGDSTLCVFSMDGMIHRRYRLPDGIFGCKWHPTKPEW